MCACGYSHIYRTVSNDFNTLVISFWIQSWTNRGARGEVVIVAGYGHGDTSSNPGPDRLHFI